jgi:hypothetical protein
MLCAVSAKKRSGTCYTGNLGSTTDITMLVLGVELPVQTGLLAQVHLIQGVFEEHQL